MNEKQTGEAVTPQLDRPTKQDQQGNFNSEVKQQSLFSAAEMPTVAPKTPPKNSMAWRALVALSNGAVTTAEFCSWRLAAYIFQLKVICGWPIKSVLIPAPAGVATPKARIARYFLDAEYQQMAQTAVKGQR